MIKFFRKIRQNLLMENKTGKYFKYAIGEIVLVVIGILIALQINNWNENRKTNSIKQSYYSQIIFDLDKETKNIEERVLFLDSSITSVDNYFELMKTPNLETTQILDELQKVRFTFDYIAFNTNTVESLESTGDIKLLPEKIRNTLIELKRKQDLISTRAKGNYGNYLNGYEKADELGLRRIQYSNPSVKDLDIEKNIPEIILTLEAAISLKNHTDKSIRNNFNEMLQDIINIKELIHIELNKK
ncbi:MAG: hypothetical protein DA407_05815 [Bacteroidetes bacterium]|nr:MAG: hypothetical protein DA407_05815 [Bacteroidota bacterium]